MTIISVLFYDHIYIYSFWTYIGNMISIIKMLYLSTLKKILEIIASMPNIYTSSEVSRVVPYNFNVYTYDKRVRVCMCVNI